MDLTEQYDEANDRYQQVLGKLQEPFDLPQVDLEGTALGFACITRVQEKSSEEFHDLAALLLYRFEPRHAVIVASHLNILRIRPYAYVCRAMESLESWQPKFHPYVLEVFPEIEKFLRKKDDIRWRVDDFLSFSILYAYDGQEDILYARSRFQHIRDPGKRKVVQSLLETVDPFLASYITN